MSGHRARATMPDPAAQLVSIVIPVFNGARYLAEAIDSALAQTWPALEVIVVDDGSDDGGATQRIAASYGPAIRLITKPNGGVGSALNAGIAAMKGAWFSWLSHDDLYLSDKVERLMQALQGRPGPAIAFSDVEFIDQDGQFIYRAGILKGLVEEPDARWLVLEGRLNGCAMIIPRECLEAVGPFDTGLPTTQDYALWFELASRFPFVPVHETLVRSRVHSGQGSRHARHLEEASLLWMQMTDRMERSDPEADPVRSLKRLRRVQRFLHRSPYHGARAHVDERMRALLGAVVEVGLVCLVGPVATPADALQRLAAASVRCTEVLLIDHADDASTAQRWDHTTLSAPHQMVRLPSQFAKPGNILAVALAHTRADVLLIIDSSAPLDDRVLHEGLLSVAAQEADIWMSAERELPGLGSLQCAVFVRAAIAPTMAAGPQAFPMLGLRTRLVAGHVSWEADAPSAAVPAPPPVLRSSIHSTASLAKMPRADRSTLLILVHALGGGTIRYAELIAGVVGNRVNVLFGWGVQDQTFQLSSRGPDSPEITYVLPDEIGKAVQDLRALQVMRVDVMHSVGLDRHLAELLDGLNVPYDFTLVDYHQIALHPHLVDAEGCFVGDDVLRRKDYPLLCQRPNRLLTEAERVIACSRDLAGRFQRLTNLPSVVAARIPEAGNPDRFAVHEPPLAMREWMRVLCLGVVAPTKGIRLLAEVAGLLRVYSIPVRIECLGTIHVEPPAEMVGNPHLRLWGRFDVGDMHAHICCLRPHLALFPFTAPETYSFTLSDAMLHGLPVLATGLGATAERLHGRPATWLLRPQEATASGITMWLDRLRRERLATPPRWLPIDHLPPLHERFYPDEYLRPLQLLSGAKLA
jgi:cellulose synthase/poly-beta-1,6-N-acetylglucosamine synthase-like glycosyltransferase